MGTALVPAKALAVRGSWYFSSVNTCILSHNFPPNSLSFEGFENFQL